MAGCCWGEGPLPEAQAWKDALARGVHGQRASPLCVKVIDGDPVNRTAWGTSAINEDRRDKLPASAHVQASSKGLDVHLVT